jgi:predicted glycoside hydrolase/deacetylase ChbG (UPF0249 family)
MGTKWLIVNADDFGFSDHTVDATIECFKRGVLSSATLMPSMPAFDKAAAFARQHPEFSYGLHLCLTDERPVSSPATIPTLVAPGGSFWPTPEFFKRVLTGRISPRDIRRETLAQVERMREAGIAVRHVDAHGHVHKVAVVPWVLRRMFKSLGIVTVRRTQNFFYRKPCLSRRCHNIVSNAFIRRLGKTTDHFLMVAGTLGGQDTHWWDDCVKRLPNGVTEVGIHPGWDEGWRRLDTSPVIEQGCQGLREAGVQLINFNQFAALTH